MSVTVETNKVTFNGDGVQTAFSFSFKIFVTTDLDVVVTDANGIETPLVLTTEYTVAATNNDFSDGGTVTVLTGSIPQSGETITIIRDLPITQTFEYTEGGKFPVSDHQDAIDKATLIAQELDEQRGRALIAPVSDPTGLDMTLDAAAARASEFLAFNEDGEPISSSGGVTVPVSTFMAGVLDDADAAEAMRTLQPSQTQTDTNHTITDSGASVVRVSTGASDRTITLPTLADNLDRKITIVKVDSAAGDVIIDGEGAEAMEGRATITLVGQDSTLVIRASATEWEILQWAGGRPATNAKRIIAEYIFDEDQELDYTSSFTDEMAAATITFVELPLNTVAILVYTDFRDSSVQVSAQWQRSSGGTQQFFTRERWADQGTNETRKFQWLPTDKNTIRVVSFNVDGATKSFIIYGYKIGE